MQQIIGNYIFKTLAEKPSIPVIRLEQIHSNIIISPDNENKKADGFYIRSFDQINDPLCILTADCLPIFILGKEGLVFLHAGWRGLASGILFQPQISQNSKKQIFVDR